jgi:hypothetical protein
MRVNSIVQSAFLAVIIGMLVGCSRSSSEEARYSPEVQSLVRQGDDLWMSGKHDEAVDKYTEIFRLDPTNPYGSFGFGMESARQQIDGTEQQQFSIARASLQRNLDSGADRGGGAEAERRGAAEDAIRPLAGKLAKAEEDEDGYALHEGLRRFKRGGKWGFEDATGKTVIEPVFDFVRNFNEDLAPAKEGDRWGYIGRDGKFAIKPQFEDAHDFDHGIGWVKPVGAQSGFQKSIDRSGNFAVDPKYYERSSEKPRAPKGSSIVGTFSGEEGGGSIIKITFAANKTFELSQRGAGGRGTYKKFVVPHPEKGGDNVYYELDFANHEYRSQIGFYSAHFDKFYLVAPVDSPAGDRLLKFGPHPEITTDLDRER